MSMPRKKGAKLKAPFPYYGGKSRAAGLIWPRLGDVDHYIEPFLGSGANMLARPTAPRVETVNDADCYLSNFWRCVGPNGSQLASTLAALCNYPVSELDLHASHRWLVGVTKPVDPPSDWAHGPAAWADACRHFRGTPNAAAITFRERMRNDPDYKDPLYAARWVWGICMWIGGGWCQTRDDAGTVENPEADEDRALTECRPFTGGFEGQRGQGIHGTKEPGGEVLHEKRPALGSGIPNVERRPALSTGGGPRSQGHGVHSGAVAATWERIPDIGKPGSPTGCGGIHAGGTAAGREVLTDQRPDLGGEPGRGIHQTDGVCPAEWERLPDAQKCQTGGRGVHGVGAEELRALSEGRPQIADAFDIGRGVHSGKDFGTMAARLDFLERWFRLLADRLRLVRVCCGDWSRVVGSQSVTTRLGVCGIFFDPPYGVAANRDGRLYGADSLTVADDVRAWCILNQGDPKMRICLAGYEEEHRELSDKHGWTMIAWESKGYGNRSAAGKENQKRERLWFSPHCLKPKRKPAAKSLFD